MIDRKILYYPTILAPAHWLKWATLYWDMASSIIPYGWERNPVIVHPQHKKDHYTMQYLQEEGLFTPTRPGDLLRGRRERKSEAFFEELRRIVTSVEFQACTEKNWVRNPVYRIHGDKFTHQILSFLHELGLTDIDSQDSSWFFVEKNTALLYMGLLAKHLADQEIDFTVPSTDREEYETMIYGSDTKEDGFPSLGTKFLDVLPVPRDNVSIRDIVGFKKKKRDDLLHFREVIDEFQKEISHAESAVAIKQILVQQNEKIRRERSNLNKLMKSSGIKTAFATFRSLFGIKSPALVEALGFSWFKTPPEVSIPIVAATAFFQVGTVWIDNRNKRGAEIRESPFSYLYYAEREGLIE